jgi:hypothetical protein
MCICKPDLSLENTDVDIPSDSPPYTIRDACEKTCSTSWATQTIVTDRAQQRASQEGHWAREASSKQSIARGRQPVLPQPAI